MADLNNNTSLKNTLDEIEKKVIQAETDRNSLEAILPTKGVEVVSGSKMLTLIGKVDGLSNTRWESGDGFTFIEDANSVNYKCNTEYKLLRSMNFGDIDLKGFNVGRIKVNVNFQNGSTDGSNRVYFYVKVDIVDSIGVVYQTSSDSFSLSAGDNSNIVRDLKINLSKFVPGRSIRVYGKTSLEDRWIRINNVKVCADLKVSNTIVPFGKRWAKGYYDVSSGTNAEYGFEYVESSSRTFYANYADITNIGFIPSIIILTSTNNMYSPSRYSTTIYHYDEKFANRKVIKCFVSDREALDEYTYAVEVPSVGSGIYRLPVHRNCYYNAQWIAYE